MDSEKIPTLVKNFPDVFLALVKRMDAKERQRVLKDFAVSHPKSFKQWHTPDVQAYLKSMEQQ